MPSLDFFVDYKPFLRVALGSESVSIGRGGDCDVQLPDPKVSRRHAFITVDENGDYWIENLSANGTRLNAAMIDEKTKLTPGDRVYIASYAMVYYPEDAPVARYEDDETIFPD